MLRQGSIAVLAEAQRRWALADLRVKLAALLLALSVVCFVANDYVLNVAILVGIYIMLGAGLHIVVGLAGLLDLGYIGFYAIGAYLTAIMAVNFDTSFWILLPLSGVLAGVFGLVLGYPVLRLRGDYLAIVTLGFGEIIRIIINNWDSVTGNALGMFNIPHPVINIPGLFTYDFGFELRAYYLLIVVLGAITVFGVHRLANSRIGLAWRAIREDETAAEIMGIDVVRMKLLAFGIGAGIAGLAGSFFAARMYCIFPTSFTFAESLLVVCVVIASGAGSLQGVALGALMFIAVPELLRELQRFRMLAFGPALIVLMIFRPQGVFGRGRVGLTAEEEEAERQLREIYAVETPESEE